jgi:hypothetical protein
VDGEVCIANIGPRQRRMRLIFGLVTLAVTAAGAVGLHIAHVRRPWVFALTPLVLSGCISVFQHLDKT